MSEELPAPEPREPNPVDPGESLAVEGLLLELGRCREDVDAVLIARTMERVAAQSVDREPSRAGRAADLKAQSPSVSEHIQGTVAGLNKRPSRRMAAPDRARQPRRVRSRRAWMVAAAVAALVLVVAGGRWFFRTSSMGAEVTAVSGQVEILRDGGRLGGKVGMRLQSGDRIETGAGATASVRYLGEATRLELGGDSSMELSDEEGAKRIQLERGLLSAQVAPQPPGRPLLAETPHARAEVVGTRFTLETALERTRLEVQEGKVRLAKAGAAASILVQSGWCAVAAPREELVATLAAPAPAPAPAAAQGPAKRDPPEAVVFLREFDALPPGEHTDNELVRLREADGEVTALASKPFTDGSPNWNPDVHLGLFRWSAAGKGVPLYKIPERLEIRIRLKSEKPGTWYISQQPVEVRSKEEGLASATYEIDSHWREVVLHGGDFTPYRRPHVHTPDLAPGLGIGGFSIYGFGTSRIFVDRFAVVSLAREKSQR